MSAAAKPEIVHRFFFALRPDEITARRTHAYAESELGAKGLLEPERLHITMAITEDWLVAPQALVEALLRAGDAVRSAPFALTLDRLSGGTGTVALRPSRVVPPLQELQTRIAAAMTAEGLPMRREWNFNPHQTLSYRKGTPFSRPCPGFDWTVTEFYLVHSYVGLHRHDIVRSWSLIAPEDRQGRLL